MEDQLCPACERNPVTIVDDKRFSPLPYHLCGFCFERLKERALRPLEYFRLRRLHGPAYDISADFYTDEGKARSPYIEMGNWQELPFPTVEGLQQNLSGLIDYALVRWHFPLEVVPALQQFPDKDLFGALDRRIEDFPHLEGRLIEIGAEVWQDKAYGWVRFHLSDHAPAMALAHAKAVSLSYPQQEGLALIRTQLEALDERKLREQVMELAYFGSPDVLDWLEALGGRLTRIHPNYGYVAAASRPDWLRLQAWLAKGGAWGRMALDALVELAEPATSPALSPWFRRFPPSLPDKPSAEVLRQALESYLQLDTHPKSVGKVSAILDGYANI